MQIAANTKEASVADKAAALTYLKGIYTFPKSFTHFNDLGFSAEFSIVPVSNTGNGGVMFKVLTPTNKQGIMHHIGEFYPDVMSMVNMTHDGRNSYIVLLARKVVNDYHDSKKGLSPKTQVALASAQQQGVNLGGLSGLLGALGLGGSAGALVGTATGASLMAAVQQNEKKIQEAGPLIAKLKEHWAEAEQQQKAKSIQQKIAQMEEAQAFKQVMELPPKPVKSVAAEPEFVTSNEQLFAQRVGFMSNLNVTVQTRRSPFTLHAYRAFCNHCKDFTALDNSAVINFNSNDKNLVAFCQAHRHVVVATVVVEQTRRFREV